MKVMIINGVNLNMLGSREVGIYGSLTLAQINSGLSDYCAEIGVVPEFFCSNFEGEIVEKIHSCINGYDGLIINAGAHTHYSYAIADALKMVQCTKIEVHISNVFAREDFRHTSVIAPSCNGVISGFGANSYRLAVTQIMLERKSK